MAGSERIGWKTWLFAAMAFFAAALFFESRELRIDHDGRPATASFVSTTKGFKGQTSCLYEYTANGIPFQIPGPCGENSQIEVDYLPDAPNVARLRDRRGEDSKIALILALAGLGCLACCAEALHAAARLRALGPNFRSEGALPKRRK